MVNYTAKYTKIETVDIAQLVKWPEVVTELRASKNAVRRSS